MANSSKILMILSFGLCETLQLIWWNYAFKKLLNSESSTVADYQRIAAEEAIAFMRSDLIKDYLITEES